MEPLKAEQWIKAQSPVYKNWKDSGLLEDLSFEESYALSMKLEEMASLILNVVTINDETRIGTLMFPIIIRTYRRHQYLIKSCSAVYSFVNSHLFMIGEFSLSFTDPEAEFVSRMCVQISALKL